ncbi:hypothetical protein NADFUDRAFT_51370 [Nadsonia fulvescens var. elongata DSM 6958]|uniref:Uncharacterized protein n=1 Tax=Nadsonia fulvescens var. elongata DSM 6958 TaxID=857566 RepID=A0A1E3PMD9_9ASCO|nr:hypothetical protein NADFUDRAFT_51370 [Nadsonia fulvescens var. elongata DSM 6958]
MTRENIMKPNRRLNTQYLLEKTICTNGLASTNDYNGFRDQTVPRYSTPDRNLKLHGHLDPENNDNRSNILEQKYGIDLLVETGVYEVESCTRTTTIGWENFNPRKEHKLSAKDKVGNWLNKIAYSDVNYEGKVILGDSVTQFASPFTVPAFNEVMSPLNFSDANRIEDPSCSEKEDLISQQRTYLAILDYETDAQPHHLNPSNGLEILPEKCPKGNTFRLRRNLTSCSAQDTYPLFLESTERHVSDYITKERNTRKASSTILNFSLPSATKPLRKSKLGNPFSKLHLSNFKHLTRREE